MGVLSTIAIILGSIVMTAGGFTIAGGLLFLTATWSGKFAWRTWKNLSGIYMVETMKYWFRRMEADGTHVLRNAHADKISDIERAKAAASLEGANDGAAEGESK